MLEFCIELEAAHIEECLAVQKLCIAMKKLVSIIICNSIILRVCIVHKKEKKKKPKLHRDKLQPNSLIQETIKPKGII